MKNSKLRFGIVVLALTVVVTLAVTAVSGIRFLHWTLAVVAGAAFFAYQTWREDKEVSR